PLPPGNSAAGAKIFKAKCNTCHTCNEGGPNKQGPNLFGVIGRQCGQVQGFKYTGASKNSGIQWSNQTLVAYLENPKKYIKGTNMAFPGFKKDQDRVDVVAYLNTMK
ncbi:putative cytochrome c, partial [Emiliania huxleyi CCMP1516]